MINHEEIRMNYDELTAAEKIALAALALEIRRQHDPNSIPGKSAPIEHLITEIVKTARQIADKM